MRKFLILQILLFTCLQANTQVVVQVRDANTQEALIGATIECPNGSSVISAPHEFVDLQTGCKVRYSGYETYILKASDLSDTTNINLVPGTQLLSEVTIKGYQEPVKLTDVPGGYSYLPKRDLEAFNDISPLPAFNMLPGVRMEQRSPGSFRFNIRGSTLRSPFGVRNVKVYWNNIPFTEANGSTPVNMLDMGLLSTAEVIRGPAGAVYGSGIGGVIMMQGNESVRDGLSLGGGIAIGGYGMLNGDISVSHRGVDHTIQIRGASTQTDGYREHSQMDRQNISMLGTQKIDEQNSIHYALAYTDLEYQLPGGLTLEQRDEDPTMARPASVTQDARIDQNYLMGGLTHEFASRDSRLLTSAFFTSSNKVNPFVNNYEFEDLAGGGIRTSFDTKLSENIRLAVGGEWQWGSQRADNFGNVAGNPDTLRFVDENRQFTGFEYAKLSYVNDSWHISGGLSLNHLNYDFNRLQDVALDSSYAVDRSFGVVVSPRLAVVRKFKGWSAHASYSVGFSPPTLDEIRISDGSINEGLDAERGHNLEIGVRGNLFNDRFIFDLNGFQLWQENTIVNQVQEGGFSTFTNSGATSQRGLELLLGYTLVSTRQWNVFLQSAVTLNHFRFTDYIKSSRGENIDYSGNRLTGAPSSMVSSRLLIRHGGWSIEFRHIYVDEIPLNDANTVFSRSYHLVNGLLAWDKAWDSRWRVRVYGGVDNLLNQSYSLGNDLNAFGGRYFNPAAEINAFAGLKLFFYSD